MNTSERRAAVVGYAASLLGGLGWPWIARRRRRAGGALGSHLQQAGWLSLAVALVLLVHGGLHVCIVLTQGRLDAWAAEAQLTAEPWVAKAWLLLQLVNLGATVAELVLLWSIAARLAWGAAQGRLIGLPARLRRSQGERA